MNQDKVALIVGGGGIKPMGMINFFRMLEQENLKPDLIIACSGGTLVSSLWASGVSLDRCEDILKNFALAAKEDGLFTGIDYRTLLSLGMFPGGRFNLKSGIIRNEKLLTFLRKNWDGIVFEDCKIPYMTATNDLLTGEQYFVKAGSVADGVYASCALYPLLPPLEVHGRHLVDGGYSSAIPILEAVKLGYKRIIALSFSEPKPTTYSSFFEFVLQYTGEVISANSIVQNTLSVHLHHDEILFVPFNFDKVVRFWEVGSLDYINEVSKRIIAKHKDNICQMFES